MKTLADRIKSLRLPSETQAQFAERLGTTQASISRYLNGRQPDRETLIKIARKTSVSLDWLLTGKASSGEEGGGKASADDELVQASIAYLGNVGKLAAKEKSTLQEMIRDLVDSKDRRKKTLSFWEDLVKKSS